MSLSLLDSPRKPDERRRTLRVTPDPFLVIRFPSGNHGIVLDVSHEGLGVLAGAPLEEGPSIRFTLSGKSMPASEASGQLMWKDNGGKRAGVKFTHLPADLRAYIQNCSPLQEAPARFSIQIDGGTAEQSVAKAKASRDSGAFGKLMGESADLTRDLSSVRLDQTRFKMLAFFANAVTTVLACVIAVAIWYSFNRRDAADSFMHLKQEASSFLSSVRTLHAPIALARSTKAVIAKFSKPRAAPVPAAVPPVAIPYTARDAASSSISSALVPETDGRLASDESSRAPEQPVPVPVAEPRIADLGARPAESQRVNLSADDHGQTQLVLARAVLKTSAAPEDLAKAAQFLWQSVEKGNTAAELELADLYLLGKGVPKSCGQARVLLTAAQSRKNELAEHKLDDFATYGCE